MSDLIDRLNGPAPSVPAMRDAANEIVYLRSRIRDHEEVMADFRRLVRQLDVAMSGEAGAAKQASLCDLIGTATEMRALLSRFDHFGPRGGFADVTLYDDGDTIQIAVRVGDLRRVRDFFHLRGQ